MHTIIKVRSRIDIDFTDTKHKALKQKKIKNGKVCIFLFLKLVTTMQLTDITSPQCTS